MRCFRETPSEALENLGVPSRRESATAVSANLADAAENEEGALIRTLLDAGDDVNATRVDGMTALH